MERSVLQKIHKPSKMAFDSKKQSRFISACLKITVTVGGFPMEIITKIRYLKIYGYHIFSL